MGSSARLDPPPEGRPGCNAQTEKQVTGLTQRRSTAFSPAWPGGLDGDALRCRAHSVATKAGNIVAAVPALRKAGRTPSRNPRAKGHESWPEDFGLDPLKHTGQVGEK